MIFIVDKRKKLCFEDIKSHCVRYVKYRIFFPLVTNKDDNKVVENKSALKMTTPRHQRVALAELNRMDVVGSPFIPEPLDDTVFNDLLDNTTNRAMLEHSDTSIPSPDELIIRQRGRRRLTRTWSPDDAATAAQQTRSPFQRTPTKMPLSISSLLRSSPRKRLTMGSTPPETVPSTPLSSIDSIIKQELWPSSANAKKARLESAVHRPISQLNAEATLPQLLQGMSQQQLIDIIVNDLVAGDPELEGRLRLKLPLPDITPLEVELQQAKRNIFKSLPTSRLSRKTDSTAYTRASVHVDEFKRRLSMHTKQLQESSNWDALLDYITLAWQHIRSTPVWDSNTHNQVRRQCFKILACSCIAAIKHGGIHLGNARLNRLQKNLNEWSKDCDEVISCMSALNNVFKNAHKSL